MTRSMNASKARLLAAPGRAPRSRGSTGSPSTVALDPAEEVLEAVVERPRVGLDVEEDVERRWVGGSAARPWPDVRRVRRDELVAQDVVARARRAGARACRRSRSRIRGSSCRGPRRSAGSSASAGERRHAGLDELRAAGRALMPATSDRWSSARRRSIAHRPPACTPGSGRPAPGYVAGWSPGAVVEHPRLEAPLDGPVVRGVVGEPMRVRRRRRR